MIKTEYTTHSRDEMIAVAEEFAEVARSVFWNDPNALYVVRLEGGRSAGKSLLTDTIRARLFNESSISDHKNRAISHYNGRIGETAESREKSGLPAAISLLNTDYVDWLCVMEVLCQWTRKHHSGFVFIQNKLSVNLSNIFPGIGLPKPFARIDVEYPAHVKKASILQGIGLPGSKYISCLRYAPTETERLISVDYSPSNN